MTETEHTADSPPAVRVAAGQDRFGEQRSLGISTIDFKVATGDVGGLFVIEAGSVIVQRAYFKITHGKRIFRMSPIHHHFELKGWAEVTVVVRFWIIAGLLVSAGVGAFYLEWLTRAGA